MKVELSTYEKLENEDPYLLHQEELILEVTEAMATALGNSSLTQVELAERLGRSKGFVSQVLGGGKNLTLRTLADFATALNCQVQLQLSPIHQATVPQPAPR